MMIEQLEQALTAALIAVDVEWPENFTVKVESSSDLRFGDYQSNAAMVLAKRMRVNPRELATKVVEAIELDGLAECTIAGPGFINFKITHQAWGRSISGLFSDTRLGVPVASPVQTVVVDNGSTP